MVIRFWHHFLSEYFELTLLKQCLNSILCLNWGTKELNFHAKLQHLYKHIQNTIVIT